MITWKNTYLHFVFPPDIVIYPIDENVCLVADLVVYFSPVSVINI